MNILVALLVSWAHAARGGTGQIKPPSCQRSFLKRQLSPARVDELPRHRVTLITQRGEMRGLMIAAARTPLKRSRSNVIMFRLLDEQTNEVRELAFPFEVPNLKRVLIHPIPAEITEAQRRAGPDAESAFFEPHQSNALEVRSWLDLRSPVFLVVAREDAFGLEILEGHLASFTEVPKTLSIQTADGPRQFDPHRLVAAFGNWQGF